MWVNGPNRIQFYSSILLPNYRNLTESTIKLMFALLAINNQDYFKTKAVSTLIDYLWSKNRRYHYVLGFIYSVYLLLISVYIGLGDERNIPLETSIVVMAIVMFLYECSRFYSLKTSYFRNIKNPFDMVYFIFIIALIAVRYQNEQAILTRQWLYATAIIVGYIRWISFLRLFTITRKKILIH